MIGVPDEQWGEVPKAVVVAAPGQAVDAEALLAHCRAHLAAFKCPKSVDVLRRAPPQPDRQDAEEGPPQAVLARGCLNLKLD